MGGREVERKKHKLRAVGAMLGVAKSYGKSEEIIKEGDGGVSSFPQIRAGKKQLEGRVGPEDE